MQADQLLDASGLQCPLPLLRTKKALKSLQSGEVIKVLATDSGAPQDFIDFCEQTQHTLLESGEADGVYYFFISKR